MKKLAALSLSLAPVLNPAAAEAEPAMEQQVAQVAYVDIEAQSQPDSDIGIDSVIDVPGDKNAITDTVSDNAVPFMREATSAAREYGPAVLGIGLAATALAVGAHVRGNRRKFETTYKLASRDMYVDNRSKMLRTLLGPVALGGVGSGLIAGSLAMDQMILDSGANPYEKIVEISGVDSDYWILPAGTEQPFSELVIPGLEDEDSDRIVSFRQSFSDARYDDEVKAVHLLSLDSHAFPADYEGAVVDEGIENTTLYIGDRQLDTTGRVEGGSSFERKFILLGQDEFEDVVEKAPFGAFVEADSLAEVHKLLEDQGIDPDDVIIKTDAEFHDAINEQFKGIASPAFLQQIGGLVLGLGVISLTQAKTMKDQLRSKQLATLRAIGANGDDLKAIARTETMIETTKSLPIAYGTMAGFVTMAGNIQVGLYPEILSKGFVAPSLLGATALHFVVSNGANRIARRESMRRSPVEIMK